jgi:hypothetical protein
MASVFVERPRPADPRFFLKLAVAMALVIFIGFPLQWAMGRSSFAMPIAVHVHAVLFFGWTVLFVVQTAFAGRADRTLHRRLGWIGAGWATAVVIVGIYTTAMMVRRGGVPFFFTPAYFLFMNALFVAGFGTLVAAAIRLRRRTEWHRRLMVCAMAILTGPAFGRILPMPLMIPWAAWGVFAAVMLFPLAGMAADLRRRGRIHPAWWWGAGTIATIQVAIGIVAASPPGLALYHAVMRGGDAENVAPDAYPPFPPL